MTILGKALVLVVLATATASVAQSGSAPPAAPSAVNAIAPLTPPLAGTLFFGQEQRARMDRSRDRGPAFAVDGVNIEGSRSTINGFVKRSDGISTVWVDGDYKSVSDANMLARIQSTSVGMDFKSIMAGDLAVEVRPPDRTRTKASGKSRTPKRKPVFPRSPTQ